MHRGVYTRSRESGSQSACRGFQRYRPAKRLDRDKRIAGEPSSRLLPTESFTPFTLLRTPSHGCLWKILSRNKRQLTLPRSLTLKVSSLSMGMSVKHLFTLMETGWCNSLRQEIGFMKRAHTARQ